MVKRLSDCFTATQKKALITAMILAWVAKSIPLISFATQYYTIAFHELGHAITAWLFGYVAIPTFDLINGGGVTIRVSRPAILGVIVFVFIIANLILIKKHSQKNINKRLLLLFIAYVIVFFSQLHDWLISFMGAGGEILSSFLIAWYALNKLKLKMNIKALFYLFLSMLLWVNVTAFSLSLIYNQQSKIDYLNGKQQVLGGEPLTNDLVKLMQGTGLSVNFYCWLLLLLAGVMLYFLLRLAKTAPVGKTGFKNYFAMLFMAFSA